MEYRLHGAGGADGGLRGVSDGLASAGVPGVQRGVGQYGAGIQRRRPDLRQKG